MLPALAALDLSGARILTRPDAGPLERKAAEMLQIEIAARTGLRLEFGTATADAAIVIAKPRGGAADGYSIQTAANQVTLTGNDGRGTIFAAGHLLRRLDWGRGRVSLPDRFSVTTAPRTPLRGHQLGYRPKTNSYDGWTLEMWEQYIRDLAVFGTNAIELIPPRSDDLTDSPHFPLPQMETMVGMSGIAASYGLDVWIWYPALDRDYSDATTVDSALREWEEVFRGLPRIDAVFVPGGDPGHTQPKHLFALLERQATSLRRHHPNARMWMSPQSFGAEWMEEFFTLMKSEPRWLEGIVYGPQTRVTLEELRRRIPKRYPIRAYPDITHSLTSQFPVPDWDPALAVTLAREPINPRPRDQAVIFRDQMRHSIGFLTYSEGCNDDVNKFVWSGLGWDPDADVRSILRDYARYFFGPGRTESVARGILALEENWRGPLAANAAVERTLVQFQTMERDAQPRELLNWRLQQLLFRAYADAHVRDRLIAETAAETAALAHLRAGDPAALDRAEAVLDAPPPASDRRERVLALAEALYQSIRMQLDVTRYQGLRGRGTVLETIDHPLNNRLWWKARFAELRRETDTAARLRSLLDAQAPPPGAIADDLGNPAQRPHLDLGKGWAADPSYLESPRIGFRPDPAMPRDWWRFAETHYNQPLILRYSGLDPALRYRVRVFYAGEPSSRQRRVMIRLEANGVEVHPLREKPPAGPVEDEIPPEAMRGGMLELKWTREPGAGGNGRGLQIAQVWLYPVSQ